MCMGGDEGAKDATTETRADPSTVLRCAFWLSSFCSFIHPGFSPDTSLKISRWIQ